MVASGYYFVRYLVQADEALFIDRLSFRRIDLVVRNGQVFDDALLGKVEDSQDAANAKA